MASQAKFWQARILSRQQKANVPVSPKLLAANGLDEHTSEPEVSVKEGSEDEELELSFTKKQKKQKKKRATPKKPSLSARCDAFTKEVVALKSEDFNVLLTSLDMNRVRLLVHFTYSVSNDDC